jgi:prepilin-type N-terminal cleavage/methylation domain-containing protein
VNFRFSILDFGFQATDRREDSRTVNKSESGHPQSKIENRESKIICPQSKIENRKSKIQRAFTLLEVLLVIAIIALLGTVLIGGASNWLSQEPIAPEEVFWKAVQEARKTALKSEHEIRLKFDREKKRFLIIDGHAPTVLAADGITKLETPLKEFPILAATSDLGMDFLPTGKGGNAILIRGVLIETDPITHVTFYPDGTCTPFRLQVSQQGASSTHGIDPWTCAPVLEKKDTR